MASSLADLFVSYKAVEPEQVTERVTVPDIWSRIDQVLRNNNPTAKSEEEGEDIEEVLNESDLPSSGFSWWNNNPAPDRPAVSGEVAMSIPIVGTDTASGGDMQEEFERLCEANGIHMRVTSGKRPAGAAGNAEANSYHVSGQALDIVPASGYTFDDLRKEIVGSPQMMQYLTDNGLDIIDETDPKTQKKTGATGAHFHIGPDQMGKGTLDKWSKMARQGGKFFNTRRFYAQNFG